jgi:hypothetical protein
VSESAKLEKGETQAEQEQHAEGESARPGGAGLLRFPVSVFGIRVLELKSIGFLVPVDQVLRHTRDPMYFVK